MSISIVFRDRIYRGLLQTGALASAFTATALIQTPAHAADTATTLEEVIVTATRREEASQDVPIAITAFSGERLQEQNIREANDLIASVPSLVVGQNGQGIRDTPTFTLRGQGSTFQGSPGVVVYLNEVPLPAPITLSNQGGPGTYLDLAKMEVLAGPQGTLFGRNTTGGAILLTPQKPTEQFEGYLQVGAGNYNDRESEGVINVPLMDATLNMRLAFQTKDRDGYTHDYNWNVDRDDTHYQTMRLGIDWKPTDRIDNYLMGYWTNSNNKGPGSIPLGIDIPAIVGANGFFTSANGGCDFAGSGPLSCAAAAAYFNSKFASAAQYGPRGNALSLNEFGYQKLWALTNTTKFDLTDYVALRNIVSYSHNKSGYALDADGTTLYQYDTGVNDNIDNFSARYPRDKFHVFTEELQVQGSAFSDALKYTAGWFYFKQATENEQRASAIDYCFYAVSLGGLCNPAFTNPSNFHETTISRAGYAQGTLNFGAFSTALDKLSLTLGYRKTWDTASGFSSYNGGFDANLRSSAPSWVASLDYRLTDGVLVYGKASRSYKAGGINTYSVFPNTKTFGPEYNTTYEVGMKSDWRVADMPIRFNLTGYRSDYSSIQRAAGDFNPVTNVQGAVQLSDAAAIIQGVEVEVLTKFTRDLEFGLNYGYTDAYYTKFPFHSNVTVASGTGVWTDCNGTPIVANGDYDAKCRPLQYTAKHIGSAHVKYTLPLPETVGTVSAFVNYAYTSKQHTEALFGSQQPFELMDAFGLLSGSVDWKNIYSSPIDVNLFVTNATNKLYRTTNGDTYQSLGVVSTLYGEPRMYGLRVRYHWGR